MFQASFAEYVKIEFELLITFYGIFVFTNYEPSLIKIDFEITLLLRLLELMEMNRCSRRQH
eukprot:m.97445 g.97445  ORF g.97445 m.97445 type:complete len:61 (+) comp16697_c0_seq10:223-405(+)